MPTAILSPEIVVPIISAASALLGVFITQYFYLRSKEKELYFRLWEHVLKKRVESHEDVIEFAKSMRTMISLGYAEPDGSLARMPAILIGKQAFDDWQLVFHNVLSTSSTWLSVEVTRELNLLQDYIVNLSEIIRDIDETNLSVLGTKIRNDFIEFSSRIEMLAFDYFTSELSTLKLSNPREWHKYPVEETRRRLSETALFSVHIENDDSK